MSALYRIFHDNFRVLNANSPRLLDEALTLRYKVYCLEHPYEDAAAHPDGRERDGYDTRSCHSLVKYRKTSLAAGVVRLVTADEDDPTQPFPVERESDYLMDHLVPELLSAPRRSIAEISRFAVSKEFKRRLLEESTDAGVSPLVRYEDGEEGTGLRRLLPHITLGLFAGIVQMSADRGITHWYAVMEPTLLRLLTRFGIHFRALGPMIEYHGRRQPSFGQVDRVLARIHGERPDVWEIITDHGRVWPLERGVLNARRYYGPSARPDLRA